MIFETKIVKEFNEPTGNWVYRPYIKDQGPYFLPLKGMMAYQFRLVDVAPFNDLTSAEKYLDKYKEGAEIDDSPNHESFQDKYGRRYD